MQNIKLKNVPKGLIFLLLLCCIALPACAAAKKSEVKSETKNAIKSETKADTNASDLQIISPEQVYAGEPFLVSLKAAQDVENIQVIWGKKSFAAQTQLINGEKTSTILLSVALKPKEPNGELIIKAKTNKGEFSRSISLPIAQRTYPEQRLTVESKFVNPSKAEQERIKSDTKIINATLAKISPQIYWALPMSRPLPYIKQAEGKPIGRVSSVYGLRRFFNGEERNPHKGTDLSAPANQEILAAMDGKVALVGDFFYSGRCVFIDHGQGVFTTYLHMTKPLASEGQLVKRGEVIGLVGSTGRSTGPHLHFGFTVLGETVNPAPLMPSLMNPAL